MGVEAQRHMAFHCSLGDDVLVVRSLTGNEQLSTCYEYVVTLFGTDHDVKLDSLLRTHASVEIRLGRSEPRYFSGIVSEASYQGTTGRYAVYQVILRPWLWLLSRNSDCRIFQQESALDIVRKVFKDNDPHEFDDGKVFAKLKEREYCVQYRESDLNFVNRLLEDEGIYYFFQHERDKHTLILADSPSAHEPASGYETINFRKEVEGDEPVGVMFDWCGTKRVVTNKVSLTDFDFKKSAADLSNTGQNPKAPGNHEMYDYPGLYVDPDQGAARARMRAEEAGARHDVATGGTNSRGLSTGNLFTLKEHPRGDQNREYLVLGATYEVDSGSYETGDAPTAFQFVSRITALSTETQFRPARSATEPSIAGVQTAQVVGPKDQEIWTDSHGRVKVQFPWDREGKRDEASSCWIRVAQIWAGPKWGSIYIPRIGHEVVVEFVDGNVDRPLIVGCVYNDINKPPYNLPAKATQSGIKSRSTLHGGPEQYNELRFEDEKGAEEISIQAERDMSTTVKNDSTTTVKHDAKLTVTNDLTVKVAEGTYATTVDKGPMITEVPLDKYELSAKEILELGTLKIELSVAGCSLTIDPTAVKIVAFGSTITLDATGIALAAPQVKLNA